jgi:PAS domain-containing protein
MEILTVLATALAVAAAWLLVLLIRSVGGRRDADSAAKALEGTLSFIDSLVDSMRAPIVVWDYQLKKVRFNRAFATLTYGKVPETPRQPFDPLFESGWGEETLDRLMDILSDGKGQAVEIDIPSRGGDARTYLWSTAQIRSADGSALVAIVAQGQDVTELKGAEGQLREQLNELKRWQSLMLGREERVLELKREVNALLTEEGKPPRYADEDRDG